MTRPLRFCMLTTFYPPWNFGGDGIQVERLSRALADRGHSVTVACAPPVHRWLSGERRTDPDRYPGIEVVPVEGGLPSLAGRYLSGRPVGAERQLRRLLDRGFDVLHFHNPSLLGAPRLLSMGEGLKLYTAHEQWLLCPSHVLMRRNGRICENPPCASCELTHRRPPQLWRRTGLLKRSLGHLDALIAPSRTSARLHSRFASLVAVEVLPHFVPEPGAAPSQRPGSAPATALDGSGAKRYFLYVGRLEPVKGVEALIDAMRGRPEELVIAGDGGLARRLRRRAAKLGNVRFTGWLEGEDLDRLHRGALAVVIPTLGHEAMSLVALESFARGTPAIVHRFGTLGELAETTGAALAYGTPGELDAALDRVASDAPLRRRLADRGRDAARRQFSPESHLSRYLSLIACLAGERGDSELSRAAEAASGAVGEPSAGSPREARA